MRSFMSKHITISHREREVSKEVELSLPPAAVLNHSKTELVRLRDQGKNIAITSAPSVQSIFASGRSRDGRFPKPKSAPVANTMWAGKLRKLANLCVAAALASSRTE